MGCCGEKEEEECNIEEGCKWIGFLFLAIGYWILFVTAFAIAKQWIHVGHAFEMVGFLLVAIGYSIELSEAIRHHCCANEKKKKHES